MPESHVIAIIPARGGSKGIPRKNILPLAGKPLMAHSIEAALNSTLVDRTIVSTDDEEIAAVARECGAEVVMRPAELATDGCMTEHCLIHAVEEIERDGSPVDLVVLMQPTSPFRPPTLVDDCIRKLRDEGADSLLTAYATHHFFWTRTENGLDATYVPEKRPMRQDMDPRFMENGNVYITQRDLLMRETSRLGGKIELYEMEQEDSLEIDSPFDFWLAEEITKYREKVQ